MQNVLRRNVLLLWLVLFIWQVSACVSRWIGKMHSWGYWDQVYHLLVRTHVIMIDLLRQGFLAHILWSPKLVALEFVGIENLFLNLIVWFITMNLKWFNNYGFFTPRCCNVRSADLNLTLVSKIYFTFTYFCYVAWSWLWLSFVRSNIDFWRENIWQFSLILYRIWIKVPSGIIITSLSRRFYRDRLFSGQYRSCKLIKKHDLS